MQNHADVLEKSTDSDSSTDNQVKSPEQIIASIPVINRFVHEVRGAKSSGSRINVQIDWAKGRMAVTY